MSESLALEPSGLALEITPRISQQLYLRSTAKPRPQAAQEDRTPKGPAGMLVPLCG